MRDVMGALAELQAAEEAIEAAGPLYQTREPLKDRIVSLIGQRSDLITQVLALRRELDAAHARIREIEARAEAAEQERDELAANGAEIVGALEERDMARAERDEARARIRELEAVLRETHDALERLDAIYASEHDPDPVLGTVPRPAWLADALRRAAALLAPTTPTPAPTLTDAELRALREEGQRRRQRFEETLRRMQVADAQRERDDE